MYDFKTIDGEEIILISDNSLLKKDEDIVVISTILSNKRMILLDFPKRYDNYEEALRTSRGVNYIKVKEPLLEIDLLDIERIEEEKNFDKYILKSGNYFYLKDNDIKREIIKLLYSGN